MTELNNCKWYVVVSLVVTDPYLWLFSGDYSLALAACQNIYVQVLQVRIQANINVNFITVREIWYFNILS